MNARLLPLRRALVVAAALLIAAASWYPPIQSLADEQVDAGLQRAVVSFASARALNAAISVLQGTEFSVQPLGVGVTLTLGQVLDPINDLVERFAEWMLIASVAFGAQKLLLLIGAHHLVSAIVCAVALAWALLAVRGRSPVWLTRTLVVLLMVRFAVPVATLGSEFVYQQALARDYEESQQILDRVTQQVGQQAEQAKKIPPPAAERSLWDRLKDGVSGIAPSIDFDEIRKSAAELPERVVRLIAVFLLQTIVMPVLLLWALYRLAVAVAMRPAGRSPEPGPGPAVA